MSYLHKSVDYGNAEVPLEVCKTVTISHDQDWSVALLWPVYFLIQVKNQVKSKYVYFVRYIIYALNHEDRGQNKSDTWVWNIRSNLPTLDQTMTWRLIGTKPLPEPMHSSVVQSKTAASQSLMHWRYCTPTPSHGYMLHSALMVSTKKKHMQTKFTWHYNTMIFFANMTLIAH